METRSRFETGHQRSAGEFAVVVTSPRDRLAVGAGALRRLDRAPIDRQVLLMAALTFLWAREETVWLRTISFALGVPAGTVWEAVARHVVLDHADPWVGMDGAESAPAAGGCEGPSGASHLCSVKLRVRYPEWPDDFLDSALRRWPKDVCSLVADMAHFFWGDEDISLRPSLWMLGRVVDRIDGLWWLEPYFEGVKCGRGNLTTRLDEIAGLSGRPGLAPRGRAGVRLSEGATSAFLEALGRRLSANDFGALPQRILTCEPWEWAEAGSLLCFIGKRFPAVAEALEERLMSHECFFDFLAEIVEAEPEHLEAAAGLLYDMTTGTRGGAARFVRTLGARRGWDLPRPLRDALLSRLSLGLACVVEGVETAAPGVGAQILGVYDRWRADLDRVRWAVQPPARASRS